MELVSYSTGVVAVISTTLTLTRLNVVDALLYMVVSLHAVAVVFYERRALLGPYMAAVSISDRF